MEKCASGVAQSSLDTKVATFTKCRHARGKVYIAATMRLGHPKRGTFYVAPLSALLLAACPSDSGESDTENSGESGTESSTSDTTTTATETGSETETGTTDEPLECDVPELFVNRCGSQTCHGGGDASASGLDLVSPGVENRVSGQPGINCPGTLADPSDPRDSILYTKVSEPTCGVLMPIGGEMLNDDELTCLEFWISGLLPPDEPCDDCLCEPGEVEACYNGPEHTMDVGACVSGMHTCQTDGMGWGPCEGEVLPLGEDCNTPEDENCDGVALSCSDEWSIGFGDPDDESMRSVAVDADGNVYGFGDFEGLTSFGGEPLQAVPSDPPKPDIVITKHDPNGNYLWSVNFGDNSSQAGINIQVDGEGNIIGLVRMYGILEVGGEPYDTVGGMEIFIFKLDSEGNHIWSLGVGGPDADRAERFGIDPNTNDVILTGTFTDNADFGNVNFISAGLRDAFVMRIDADSGNIEWVEQIGGPADEYGFGVGVQANGNIVISGRFGDTIDIGNDELTSNGDRDVYLATLQPDGTPIWAQSFGGVGEEQVHEIAVQASGDIVVMGSMSETVDFGGGPRVSAGSRDMFVASYTSNGNHQWSQVWGDENDQFETDAVNSWDHMVVDDEGHIYVGGSLYGVMDFGGGNVLDAGGDDPEKPDAFYFELTPEGDYVGGRNWGGSGTEDAYGIAVTPTGQVVLAGRFFASTFSFGHGNTLTNIDRSDAFLAKIEPE